MNFKVGDRVRVYGAGWSTATNMYVVDSCTVWSGDVTDLDHVRGRMEQIQVKGLWVHPKQCRRLIRKERRKIWIHENDFHFDNRVTGIYFRGPQIGPEDSFIQFIEVKKK